MNGQTKQARAEILLLACYELGHQPLSLAWPVAALEEAGFSINPCDLAVEDFPTRSVLQSTMVAIATPMHTAMRIGVAAARQVRKLNPQAHICFYGLYADLNADFLFQQTSIGKTYVQLADSVISGEYELPLVRLAQGLETGVDLSQIPGISTGQSTSKPYLHRIPFNVPKRDLLPPLTKYNFYINGGKPIQAGYVEASRGCLHKCKHCPVVPVYSGRFFVIPVDVVLSDIRQQVATGVGHISFGDPDFLNGPGHVLKIVRAMKKEFPDLTFDFTTRVEHLLKYQKLLPELRTLGATFVISAFEATSDVVLQHLDKGHTVQDMEHTIRILAAVGLPVRPSWVPFTPWTTLDDYLCMLEWIDENHLVPNIPMVQYSIRLLIPPRSELLPDAQDSSWLGGLDAKNFTYSWNHPDPRMDRLQNRLAVLAQERDYEPELAFDIVARQAYDIAKRPLAKFKHWASRSPKPPRLSEHWFC
jgi:hypothetical protein